MKIVALSDTHLQYGLDESPPADLMIHCGDALNWGSAAEWNDFEKELLQVSSSYKYILYVPGNHDIWVEEQTSLIKERFKGTNIRLLIDEYIEIEGLKIYGSPWVPYINGMWAFERLRGNEIQRHWDNVPAGLDILITHGGPAGILSGPWGCKNLLQTIIDKKPRISLFGHVHSGHGAQSFIDTQYYNVSICDEAYMPVFEPTVLEW